jgi:antitoxin (DNA-binding transcriptional repressor) of toxin-antitoxin stability system
LAEQGKTVQAAAQRIGIREFQGNLSGLMRQVRQGASFSVTSRDEAVAIIQPPQPAAQPRRQPGGLRGKIHMAADFDAPPAEIFAAMEDSED